MRIGDASRVAGIPVKTIRYYEDAGLVKPRRLASGYRIYEEDSLRRLRFLSRARKLGFSIKDCRTLLALYDDSRRANGDVRAIAARRLEEIEGKLRELTALKQLLGPLVSQCSRDGGGSCSILGYLDGAGGTDGAGSRYRGPSAARAPRQGLA